MERRAGNFLTLVRVTLLTLLSLLNWLFCVSIFATVLLSFSDTVVVNMVEERFRVLSVLSEVTGEVGRLDVTSYSLAVCGMPVVTVSAGVNVLVLLRLSESSSFL